MGTMKNIEYFQESTAKKNDFLCCIERFGEMSAPLPRASMGDII
jgi:hypothetical protein